MKLYEVNQAIEDIFERMVDTETGEFIDDETLTDAGWSINFNN